MYLSGSHLRLQKSRRRSNPRLIVLLIGLIVGGLFVLGLFRQGIVQPVFVATPTATRNPRSYAEEGEAQFSAGKLDKAILAYQKATAIETQNVDYWVALARIQIYAGQHDEALKTAETALLVAPNSTKAKAILAWALDWNVVKGCACRTLAEAEAAAVQAIALDGNYAPAHAYYSEILTDSQKWEQGFREAQLALSLDPTSLDAHRAMGYANESVGNYQAAIEHYRSALAINPNLVSLYLSLGVNYRVLQQYDQAVEAFSKASAIDPKNIEPFLSLSRTYYQTDQFGTAVQYLDQALALQPANPDIHGRLGLIYFKAKNYEGAEPELLLAVKGGTYVSSDGAAFEMQGMPLSQASLEYYYTLGNLWASYEKCAADQAPALLEQVRAFAPDNPTVIGSYEESMAICRNVLAGALGTPSATSTPTR